MNFIEKDNVIIEDLDDPVKIDYTYYLIDRLVDEISIFLNKLNSTTEFESFQIPSEESCAFCSCKHLCKKYLESDIRSPRIVDGYVTDISNRNYIKLCDNRGQYFSVNKIADINIPDYDKLLGKHLLFTDVNSYVEGVFCTL